MRNRIRLNILAKVLASPVLVILLLGTVGGLGYFAMRDVVTTLNELATQEALLEGSKEIQADLLRELAYVRDYIIFTDDASLNSLHTAQENLLVTLDEMLAIAADDSLREQFQTLKQKQEEYAVILQRVEDRVRKGDIDMSTVVLRAEAVPYLNQMLHLADQIIDRVSQDADQARSAMRQYAGTMQYVLLAVVSAGLVVGLALALIVARTIVKPVRNLAEAATRMAAGDLSISEVPVTSRDEVGRTTEAFNLMLRSLRDVVGRINAASQSVMAASEQLAAAADQAANATTGSSQAITQVAAGSSEQAHSTAEANALVRQLRDAIEQIASSAGTASVEVQEAADRQHRMADELDEMTHLAAATARVSTETEARARAAAAVVERALHEIQEVSGEVGQSASRIQELDRLSEQVGAITGLISSIADQTNLLALNAAIEAARAGEHGRGFAVVADEVRKLAEQSAASAQEIADLIRNIQTGTAEAVKAMNRGTERLTKTNELAAQAGSALEEILAAVQQAADEARRIAEKAENVKEQAIAAVQTFTNVAAMTQENTAASEEMAASVEEVAEAVNRIARLAEENAAAAEEVSASVEELTASAEQVASSAQGLKQTAAELRDQVGRFRL
ncbi:methyl-accepting chemotaxis protein [Symbiobacterium thermophilum]|uniref:Methyl-accepting chemotaxis protein n=1 Tax=Symbiobacterium thermophilum TaxID=2734 RepID=A0A953I3B4_SYMTR|nr:methyl-accepting chemotaxis protein [Symbiobacterium thermophilum]MBY6277607.1 methyl-accepting chemotaxis protein [Symbiobacterium thermophilum]